MTTSDLLAIASKIDEMRKLEKAVRRLNTFDCNQGLTKTQTIRRVALECRYAAIAATMGLFTEFQRDPRGSALKLHDSIKDIESGTGAVL